MLKSLRHSNIILLEAKDDDRKYGNCACPENCYTVNNT